MAPRIQSRTFGFLPTGESVEAWTLTGAGSVTLEAITFGGIVTRLLVPDRQGQFADIVLGYADLNPYLDDRAYFGAIVGRVAGRITGARFSLDGRLCNLSSNEPPNHLHGGAIGFNRRLWDATPLERPDGAPSLRLMYCSPDGEEGYPGTINVAVTYTVTKGDAFLISTEATTDQPTPFSLTHHSYFNLAGSGTGSIQDHELVIEADEFVPTDELMTLLGRTEPVVADVNDFRVARRLGNAIPFLFQNHGDLYRLRQSPEVYRRGVGATAARLFHPESGRTLEVLTDATYLQLYTGVALDGSITGKDGIPYRRHAGVCLECQDYPDGANTPGLGDIIVRPGEPVRKVTAYAFYCAAASESNPHQDR